MHEKIAVITGASAGLGAFLAERLLREGWRLALINRSRKGSQDILDRLAAIDPAAEVDVIEADLADQDAVAAAADTLIARYPRIDALFNNAGVLLGELRESRHGNEMHFQVNTLAPYQLMRLLAGPLRAAEGTVLNVSSGAISRTGPLKINALRRPPRMRKLFGPYAQSKLALTALTNALALEYDYERVRLRSMDPGGNRTGMTAGEGMPTPLLWLRPLLFGSPQKGAALIRDAALHPKFGDRTGVYIAGGRVVAPPKDAGDPQKQVALLTLCRELTGV